MKRDERWGPVERDRSNGEQGEGDGTPITLAGVVYEKGLGAHAPEQRVRYYLGGYCTAFTAQVGVDDVQKTRGSVQFCVVADGRTVVTTPVLGAASATVPMNADIAGAQYVDLIVGTTPDGNGNDITPTGPTRSSTAPTRRPSPAARPHRSAPCSSATCPSCRRRTGGVRSERDLSNGEDAAGDGFPLKVGGVPSPRARHARRFECDGADGGACLAFTATVGLDDSHDAKKNGDVIFIVKGDGVELARTGVITWSDPGQALNVDVTGSSSSSSSSIAMPTTRATTTPIGGTRRSCARRDRVGTSSGDDGRIGRSASGR